MWPLTRVKWLLPTQHWLIPLKFFGTSNCYTHSVAVEWHVQCPLVPGSFWANRVGQDPSDSKSNRLHVHIFRFCFFYSFEVYSIDSSILIGKFLEVSNFNRLFLKLMGWSHRAVPTPSVGISGCNSEKSGGPSSISWHNPQQFHG